MTIWKNLRDAGRRAALSAIAELLEYLAGEVRHLSEELEKLPGKSLVP